MNTESFVVKKKIKKAVAGDVLISYRYGDTGTFSTDFIVYSDERCLSEPKLVFGICLVLAVDVRIGKSPYKFVVKVVSSDSSVGYLWLSHDWEFEVMDERGVQDNRQNRCG